MQINWKHSDHSALSLLATELNPLLNWKDNFQIVDICYKDIIPILYPKNFNNKFKKNNPFKNNLEIQITYLLHLHRKRQHQTIVQKVKICVFDNSVTKTKGKISSYLGEGFRESDYDSEGQGRPKRDVIEFNTRHYLLCRDARLSPLSTNRQITIHYKRKYSRKINSFNNLNI